MTDDPFDRTPEQLVADRVLAAAIQACLTAYDAEGVLMELVVVTAQHITDDAGVTYTAVGHYVPDGLPLHRLAGLLLHELRRTEAKFAGGNP